MKHLQSAPSGERISRAANVLQKAEIMALLISPGYSFRIASAVSRESRAARPSFRVNVSKYCVIRGVMATLFNGGYDYPADSQADHLLAKGRHSRRLGKSGRCYARYVKFGTDPREFARNRARLNDKLLIISHFTAECLISRSGTYNRVA